MLRKKIMLIFCTLVFMISGMVYGESETVTIMHTNDMHARVKIADDSGRFIGLAEITAAVKTIRQKNPGTLFVDAGDTLHGMPIVNISQGKNMVIFMNEMGYDCMVPGNHDFNYGEDQLYKLSKNMDFPVLSANIVDTRTGKLVYKPYEIRDVNGVKVGIFGLTTPETKFKAIPSSTSHTNFLDPVTVSRQMVKQLRSHVDVLVAVTHIGIDKRSEITTNKLAKEVPGIDVIIDGHSHTELPHGLEVGDTLIAQTGYHDHQLGRVDIKVENHKIISKSAYLYTKKDVQRIAPIVDAKLDSIIKATDKKNEPLFGKIVSFSPITLGCERESIQKQETELGNLIADALRWKTQAEVGFVNSGNIRADLREGPVTMGSIQKILPFDNTVMKINLTGQVLKGMLEHSVSANPETSGGFLQVSGLTFDVDYSKPVGQRVSNVMIGSKALDENYVYTAGIPNFLTQGGDGYTMLAGVQIMGEMGSVDDCFADYLNQVTAIDYRVGRINVISQATAKAA